MQLKHFSVSCNSILYYYHPILKYLPISAKHFAGNRTKRNSKRKAQFIVLKLQDILISTGVRVGMHSKNDICCVYESFQLTSIATSILYAKGLVRMYPSLNSRIYQFLTCNRKLRGKPDNSLSRIPNNSKLVNAQREREISCVKFANNIRENSKFSLWNLIKR